ncbi:hypothetical protein DBR43_30380 [Pedobacter sp. KBW06]|nr:hypothetical protein DBR43_30380 [Pedobacter sp. KBW06]
MNMNRSIKIIIAAIALVIIMAFIFNPFYWLMQPGQIIEQPALSSQEQLYFKELEKTYNCKSERFYYNYTKKGTDTLYEDYNKVPFEYYLSIDFPLERVIQKDSLFMIAQHVKDVILNKNKNLKSVIIYRNYDTHEYLYDVNKDALTERKD